VGSRPDEVNGLYPRVGVVAGYVVGYELALFTVCQKRSSGCDASNIAKREIEKYILL
jgi:hypothetical protein